MYRLNGSIVRIWAVILVVTSITLGASFRAAAAAPPRLPLAAPAECGMLAEHLNRIDGEVEKEIAAKKLPGCVVLIARQGKIAFLKAYGNKQVEPEAVPMTTDTVFDMASVTKPVATATSVMLLVQQGKLQVRDLVSQHIPEFAQNGKDKITVEQLLIHESGLIPDNALADYQDGPEKAMERIYALAPRNEPGTKFIYSDVNFITLGEIVRRLSGKNVHEFSQEYIFGPLGMSETGFLPREELRSRAAPTQQREGRWMRGEVHDPRAYLLDGVAGHAGLFSTAADLAVFGQMMLGRGSYQGVRVLSPQTWALMTQPVPVSSGYRCLGWDNATGYSSNRGELMSASAFGHGGFTGTGFWIDPELDLFVVFLSNRVHPNGKGLVNPLIGRIGAIAVAAIENPPQVSRRERRRGDSPASSRSPDNNGAPLSPVLTGIDVLERDGFKLLQGRRVGLITNHTGINRAGVSTVKLLHDAPGVSLVALFSPEHGIAGKLDVSKIADARDEEFNLPIFSLYGETRKPTPESLKGIDTLVFDIQDIGCRFYTYPATMGNAMRAAAEHKIRFVVLDRPNPINGVDVAGPVLDAGKESFVGYHRVPVRHGMTLGELARMYNDELKIGADLAIVPFEGWRRSDFFDATGLFWVNPSPNMRNLNEALLYPGIGLLETTNLSVGRGTDTPFEIIGAPWVDGRKLADELNRAKLPGVRFVPTFFTPTSSKFKDERCGGVQILITDRREVIPVRTGLEVARQLRLLFPNDWQTKQYDRLLASRIVFDGVLAGMSVADMEKQYQPELDAFLKRRETFLIYKN
jgi:uncharacterized protein YbbC (DUF1343 family)/CubicO group peptidase (beta-lactamase class C family)